MEWMNLWVQRPTRCRFGHLHRVDAETVENPDRASPDAVCERLVQEDGRMLILLLTFSRVFSLSF